MSRATHAGVDPNLDHLPWLRALARRLAVDPHDADDYVQDTWLATTESPVAPTDRRRWLGGILRNRHRMGQRSEARRRAREGSVPPPSGPDLPDEALGAADVVRALRETLAALAPRDRSLLSQRFEQELSSAAIARRLGVAPSTVRNQLRRALQRLRTGVAQRVGGNERAWTLALGAPIVPAPPATGAVSSLVGTGGSAMAMTGSKSWGLAVLGAAVAVAITAWPDHPPSASEPSSDALVAVVAPASSSPRSPSNEAAPPTTDARQRWQALRAAIDSARTRRALAPEDRDPAPAHRALDAEEAAARLAQAARQLPPAVAEALEPLIAQLGEGLFECFEDLGTDASGKVDFQLKLLGEPGIGTVVDSISTQPGSTIDADATACVQSLLYELELPRPLDPVLQDLNMRLDLDAREFNVGWQIDVDNVVDLLEDYPELMAEGADEFRTLLQDPELEAVLREAVTDDPSLGDRFPALAEALAP